MNLSEDSGTSHTQTFKGGPSFEHEPPRSSEPCQTGSGSSVMLRLLEFKSLLLEVIEELQIHRAAKMLFEDQISTFMLEKQEMEWEKESLQNQKERAANQHTEALINMQKQFQAKVRHVGEVKLQKYNLEKKALELEQKIALQSRSRDSHLNQLGEIEKHFSALSRHCNMVKQAQEKLEQNVDEAMKMNAKLTSAKERPISAQVPLQKELEVRDKLIKANMLIIRHDKTQNLEVTEKCIQQLHLKLNMEMEMNKKLLEDNLSVREEKQEVMRSLRHAQQLLLSQTQAVSKAQMELQVQKEQCQKTGSSDGVGYCSQLLPTLKEEIIEKETPGQHISSSDQLIPQHFASEQTDHGYCLEDTARKQADTGVIEG
ncbi:coiled-coil domain-containing protein 73-like isoform X2 [Xyrichtys novacula]|nr:coiled-coil domain-containing protein 73-like isoform X2 [Xyrichtys novacula]